MGRMGVQYAHPGCVQYAHQGSVQYAHQGGVQYAHQEVTTTPRINVGKMC